jgi:YfdX protein
MKKHLSQLLTCLILLNSTLASAANDTSYNLSPTSKQIAEERIEREANQAAQKPNTRPVVEALSAVEETRDAVQLLDQQLPNQAKEALTRALGKTDLLLSNHPNASLIPITTNVSIIDTQANEATVNKLSKETNNLIKKGRLQEARLVLRNLASEINVTTANLAMGTYPSAIRLSSRLIDQGRLNEAKTTLLAALQSLVVIESTIPLPVVRAQALIDEVSRQAQENRTDKVRANQLLTEADQQIALAEKLGYGTRKSDFADLRKSLKDTKQMVNRNQEPKNLLARVRSSLQSLKDQIFRSPTGAV